LPRLLWSRLLAAAIASTGRLRGKSCRVTPNGRGELAANGPDFGGRYR